MNLLCLGNDRSNPIFGVYRSLEVIEDAVPNLLQFPIVTNPLTTALTEFNMNNVTLSFIRGNIMSPTCSGFLRDRRISKTTNCPRIQKSAVSSWALTCRNFQKALLIWKMIILGRTVPMFPAFENLLRKWNSCFTCQSN